MADDLIERLRAACGPYKKISFPSDLLLEAADALASKDKALEEMRSELDSWRRVAERLEGENQVARKALQQLANEVGGLIAFEIEVRQAIGNTNWNVLQIRLGEADTLLSARPNPPSEGDGK